MELYWSICKGNWKKEIKHVTKLVRNVLVLTKKNLKSELWLLVTTRQTLLWQIRKNIFTGLATSKLVSHMFAAILALEFAYLRPTSERKIQI